MSYDPQQSQKPQPQQGGGGPSMLVIGCVGVLLVSLVVCCGGAFYLYSQGSNLAAEGFRTVINAAIDDSEMLPEDKRAIKEQVDRVVDKYKAGEIDMEDLAAIGEEVSKSPLLSLGIVYVVEEKYVKPSGLTQEEKVQARQTLLRVAHGVATKQISEGQLDRASNIIMEEGADGKKKMKDNLTDEELKEFLAECKTLADDAGIEDEPPKVNIGEEFKNAIDRALEKRGKAG